MLNVNQDEIENTQPAGTIPISDKQMPTNLQQGQQQLQQQFTQERQVFSPRNQRDQIIDGSHQKEVQQQRDGGK